ncbi:KAP family P-loop NTPase fold protein [Chryseobacterium oryctis]|uniref:KAP family NTPase n=1 Tax=Chryseobacterium oryctis TaxID=2952618 RepID=A0ABT3HNG4_9FLAO|nr:KAP family NTPase [Chryseobacterium oryctis]MCW3161311.1 KAP family NTPase [Chryseobacterium oryctis]
MKNEIKLDKFIKFFVLTFLALLSFGIVDYLIETKFILYLSKIRSSYLLDFIFLIILLVYSALQINNCKTTYPDEKKTFYLFLIVLYYSHIRFFSDFQPLQLETAKHFNSRLFYADIIYVVLFLNLGNYIKFFSSNNSNAKSKILLEDDAIEDFDQDLLGNSLKPLVEKLNNIVDQNNFQKAFTIGINSEWGTGKTSTLNLLKKELEKTEHIIIEYNPWMGFDKKVLIEDFFNTLSEHIEQDSLNKDLDEYSNRLLTTPSPLLKDITSYIPFLNNKTPSLEKLFKLINKKLKLLNQKIIIIIDDVDRLDNKEIFEILKLIRNSANFTNIFFIVAYDRSYVNNSIDNINHFHERNYLDKIINIELSLPYFDPTLLKNTFKNLLLEKIGSEYNDKVSYALNNGFIDIEDLFKFRKSQSNFTQAISNMREVKKLVNSIITNYKNILSDINFSDMIYLEILKLKYPSIYRLLYTQKEKILIESKGYLFLKARNEKDKDGNDKEIKIVEEVIANICLKEKIGYEDKQMAIAIINYLFDYSETTRSVFDSGYSSDPDKLLSVDQANKFERYFANVIFENNISENDFKSFLQTSENMIREATINKWIAEGKEDDLKYRLENLKNFSNKEEFENTLKSILALAQSKSNKGDFLIGFDIRSLRDKIEINGQPEDTQLRFYSTPNEYRDFINYLLNSSFPPHRLERELLISALKGPYDPKYGMEFPLTKQEMQSRLEQRFYEHIESKRPMDWDFWGFYHSTKHLNSTEKYQTTLRDYITNDSNRKEFALALIEQIPFEKLIIIRKEFIEQLFGSIENFELYLDKMGLPGLTQEFKDIYYKIKGNNWLGINYKFQNIPFVYQ